MYHTTYPPPARYNRRKRTDHSTERQGRRRHPEECTDALQDEDPALGTHPVLCIVRILRCAVKLLE